MLCGLNIRHKDNSIIQYKNKIIENFLFIIVKILINTFIIV